MSKKHSNKFQSTPTQPDNSTTFIELTRRSRRAAKRRRYSQWLLWIVAAAIIVGGLVIFNQTGPSSAVPVSAERMNQDPTLGPENAPVTLIEYGDFGCTTCRAWHLSGIRDQILSQFAGKVRYVWRDFPIITPQSPKAAEAGQCAFDQGKFFEYQDAIYRDFGKLSVSDLKNVAIKVGLDTAKFDQCLDSGQYAAKVQHDWNEAKQLPVQATPAWVVNGQNLYNASPDKLTAAIQQALGQ